MHPNTINPNIFDAAASIAGNPGIAMPANEPAARNSRTIPIMHSAQVKPSPIETPSSMLYSGLLQEA